MRKRPPNPNPDPLGYTRPRRRMAGRVFTIREIDSGVRERWCAYCRRRGYSMVRAVEAIMRDAAGRRRRIPPATGRDPAWDAHGTLNLRQMHPDTLRAFKAYCILYDHRASYAIEWLMAEAIAEDRQLPAGALLPPRKRHRS